MIAIACNAQYIIYTTQLTLAYRQPNTHINVRHERGRGGAGNNWWFVFEVTFIVKHPKRLIVLKYDGQNKVFNMLEKSTYIYWYNKNKILKLLFHRTKMDNSCK